VIRARKRFGQNFLEPAWVDKVVAAIAPTAGDTFLEIGPGHGALTRPLAARAGRVVAFEIDRDLAADLAAAPPPNLVVEPGDFLDVAADRIRELVPDWRLATGDWRLRVAGNLPYNVASPIMFKLVDLYVAGIPLADATLMLQREVADRLTAVPGTRDYGILTVLIGHHATSERVLALPPGAFRPVPKVRSALVRLRFHPPDPPARDESVFAAMVQAVFTRRRKTLANALLAFAGAATLPPARALAAAGIDGRRRPETLSIAELIRVADVFAAKSG
jgi:16S rRNA (adenine1518-N6/adenine1519-N6)-dimethyltransferase